MHALTVSPQTECGPNAGDSKLLLGRGKIDALLTQAAVVPPAPSVDTSDKDRSKAADKELADRRKAFPFLFK